MLIAVLCASVAVLAFTYVGYPLVMALRARVARRASVEGDWLPRVTALVVVHDAPHALAAKIANLLALDYPPERLSIRVACDGVDDIAAAHARALAGPRVTVRCHARRRGKSACLGDLLRDVDDDVVLFCDVRQRVDAGALRALVRRLADPDVGAVSGELMLEGSDGGGVDGGGVDGYWRYEKWIRRNESASGSVPGVTGALYVARRALVPTVPPGLILDDVWIPLAIAAHGARVLFAGDALAWDTVGDAAHEDRRKRRTLAGNYQLIALSPSLLLPWRHPLGWRLFGHKWLRLAAPWLLVVAFVAAAALATRGGVYAVPFVVQCGLYLAAALGVALPRLRALRLATTFVRLNVAAARGLVDFVRDPRQGHLWPARRRPS